jgi:hypothetical protein
LNNLVIDGRENYTKLILKTHDWMTRTKFIWFKTGTKVCYCTHSIQCVSIKFLQSFLERRRYYPFHVANNLISKKSQYLRS